MFESRKFVIYELALLNDGANKNLKTKLLSERRGAEMQGHDSNHLLKRIYFTGC